MLRPLFLDMVFVNILYGLGGDGAAERVSNYNDRLLGQFNSDMLQNLYCFVDEVLLSHVGLVLAVMATMTAEVERDARGVVGL